MDEVEDKAAFEIQMQKEREKKSRVGSILIILYFKIKAGLILSSIAQISAHRMQVAQLYPSDTSLQESIQWLN